MEQTTITEFQGRQPQHTHCMRCHRRLKNTHSRGIGLGPVCERKAVADARAVKDAMIREPKMTESAAENKPPALCEVA